MPASRKPYDYVANCAMSITPREAKEDDVRRVLRKLVHEAVNEAETWIGWRVRPDEGWAEHIANQLIPPKKRSKRNARTK